MIKNGIFQKHVYLNGYKMVNCKAKTTTLTTLKNVFVELTLLTLHIPILNTS